MLTEKDTDMLYEIRYIRRSLSALHKTGASGLIAMIPAILILLSSCSGKAIGDAQDFSPNNPPQIDAVNVTNLDESAVDPAKIEPFASFKVTVTASDPDSDVLSYSFNSDCGSFTNITSTATGCTAVFKTGSITGGQKLRLSAKTSDTKGGHASRSYDMGSGKTGPTISAVFDTIHIQPGGKVTLTLSANCSGFYQIVPDGSSASTVDFNKDMMLYKFSADTPTQCTIAGPTCVSGATAQLPAKAPYTNDKYYNITIVFRDGLFQSDTFEQLLYVDGTAPNITSSSPANNADKISTSTTATFTFDEAMDPASFASSCLTVTGGTVGTITFAGYNETTKTVSFTVSGLSKRVTYTTALNGLKDLAGNTISSVSRAFTTIPFTVTFDANGATAGTVPSAITEYTVTLPSKETCNIFKQDGLAYYGFKGWAEIKTEDPSQIVISLADPLLTDKTLYAVWGNLSIGDRGPAGGWIFYISNGSEVEADQWKYMEAAKENIPNPGLSYKYWSTDTITDVGTNTAIGSGLHNTSLILTQLPDIASYAYACKIFRGGNFSDWFLPSLDETSKLYNLYSINLGNLEDGVYATSSEHPSNRQSWYYAENICASWYNNAQNKPGDPGYSIRPVRRFK